MMIATIGTFDGLHLGHQALLDELRRTAIDLGMKPSVVTFDPVPSVVLAPEKTLPQITSTSERVALLRNLGFDNLILLSFNEHLVALSAEEFMLLLKEKYDVQALLLGYDHHFGKGAKLQFEDYRSIGEKLGLRVLQAKPLERHGVAVSSSRIRTYLLEGKVQEANELLGRPYTIAGQVVGGLQIGRSLGYPTANIKPNDIHKLIPADGVYAVRVWLDKCSCGEKRNCYDGMLYIGDRPTLGGGLARTIEVNIFDLSANLYAVGIKIEFIAYVRANQRFSSLEALQAQIARDEIAIREILSSPELEPIA